jgi:hypothetical protein
MNPTLHDAMQAIGADSKAQFAREIGLPKQSMTGRQGDSPLPDAWCWRLWKKHPDIFGPPPSSQSEAA